jgi:hypothetical protein
VEKACNIVYNYYYKNTIFCFTYKPEAKIIAVKSTFTIILAKKAIEVIRFLYIVIM